MIDQEANGVVGAGPEEEQHRLAKQLLQGGHFSFQCRVNPLRCLRSEVKSLSCVRLFATPWTVAYQAPPSMGFSRQEY